MKLTIQNKLVALVIGVVVVFLGLALFLFSKLNSATAEMGNLYEKDFRQAVLTSEIDGLGTRIDINILRMLAIGAPDTIAGWKKENAERFGKAEKLIEQMVRDAEPAQAAAVEKLRTSFGKMRAGMEHQIATIEAGNLKEAGEVNRLEVKDNADAVFGGLSELAKSQQQSATNRFEAQQASAATTRGIATTAIIATALLSLLCAVLIGRAIARPIRDAADIANRLADGDLMVQINVTSKDETGQLLTAMQVMASKLSEIISSVRSTADNLTSSSEQVSATAQSMSQATSEQAASVEQTSAAVEQMSASINQNTDNARVTDGMASQAAKQAVEGGGAVKETVAAMKSIAGKIGIIDDIAYQTNLLALNAAIEAARAGEHGKGFAVVAAEVRKLAERSQVAAQEISELASGSVEKAESAGKLLDDIVPAIGKTSELVQEIAAASSEQSSGAGQINTAMNQLNQITQQNASSSEELAATAEEMSSQAAQLQEVMGFFKVDAGQASAGTAVSRAPTKLKSAPVLSTLNRAVPQKALANEASFVKF